MSAATEPSIGDAIVAASRPNPQGSSAEVARAVRQASTRTGIDFAYLMEKAAAESSFDPNAKASTSTAAGLYQFIESTWLNVVKDHGRAHRLYEEAGAIQHRPDGTPYIDNPEMRQRILDLRYDPEVSSLMVAEFTTDNRRHLEQSVGGDIGNTELYMAHFLGAGGASKFLLALRADENHSAAGLFPDAARANRAIFFDDTTGRARTVGEIYRHFAGKFSDEDLGSVLAERGQGRASGYVPGAVGGVDPLRGAPISMFMTLALAALQTPEEIETNHETVYGSKRYSEAGPIDDPLNDHQRRWHDKEAA